MYCLVMISIRRSKTAQRRALEIQDKFSLRQNAVHDKIQSKNFFPMVGNFFFQTEFCLRLHTAVVFCMQLFNLFVVSEFIFHQNQNCADLNELC